MNTRRSSRAAAAAAACSALLAALGCGPDEGRLECHPVSGSVTVQQSPAAGATVVFIPMDETLRAADAPMPKATTGADGTFQMSSYTARDGAPAGQYRVVITWEAEPGPGVDPEEFHSQDRLRGKYSAANSELTVDVPPEATELPPFDL